MHSISNVSKSFIAAEKEGCLFDYQYEGIPIWWFARSRIFYYIFRKMSNINVIASTADALSIKDMFNKLRDSIHFNKFQNHAIMGISTSSLRRAEKNGKQFDVLLDYISCTVFQDKYAILETPDITCHSVNSYSRYRYYADYMVLKGNLYRRITNLFLERIAQKSIEQYCKKVYNSLIRVGLDIEFTELLLIVCKEYMFAKGALPIAQQYLDEINPKVIIVECGYSPSHMIIQYAAKKRGIPIIELQHGLFGNCGIEYFFGLNDKKQIADSPFPDGIAVFGNHFKEILLENPFIGENQLHVIGYPYFWEQKQKHIQKDNLQSNTGRLLITSQPGFTEFYANLALELTKIIPNQILFKLHPTEIKKIPKCLEALKNEKINVLPYNMSIYEALKQAEFHISSASTTHLEALALGIKDILVNVGGFEQYYQFLIDMGLPNANKVNDIKRIIKDYPNIDNIFKYVQQEVFNLNQNPVIELENLLNNYL